MELENLAKGEIDKIAGVVKSLELIDHTGRELFELIESYFIDSKHFYENRQYLQAFEAAVICWAYIDAGLHLKVFEVPKEFSKLFTV